MIDKRLVNDLNSLMRTGERPSLTLMDQRKGLPAGRATAAPSATGTGGISSPLTEQDAATRTYHPESGVTSSDGIFVLELEPLHEMYMEDADGKSVKLVFDDPNASP